MNEQDKRQITNLTLRIVSGQIEKGELDPNDDKALKKATREAAAIAKEAYFAALEFVS